MARYDGRFAIWGPPGTGKTTFLAAQAKEIVAELGDPEASPFSGAPAPVVVCSLTKTAAAEIAGRDLPIPPRQIGTLHALAFRMVGHPDVAEGELQDWCEFSPEYRMTVTPKKGASAETSDQMFCDWSPDLKGDMLYQDMCRFRAMRRPRDSWNMSLIRFEKRWNEWKLRRGLMDFTDLIEHALDYVDEAPGSPQVVIADEAQDMSKLELELLMKWGDAAGGLMLSGDPWQALYCWRGADPTVFTDERIPEAHKKVLSQSYRVPGAVHRASMEWMKRWYSEWHELAYNPRKDDVTKEVVEGSVQQINGRWQEPGQIIDTAAQLESDGKTVMIAATCGFMLRSVVDGLRRDGIPFSNPWRRRRGDWNPLHVARGTPISERLLDFLRIDKATYTGDWEAAQPRLWTWGELANWTGVQKVSAFMKRGAKKDLKIVLKSNEHIADVVCKRHELEGIFKDGELDKFLGCGDRGETSALLSMFSSQLQASRKKSAEYPVTVARKRGIRALAHEPKIHVGTVHSFKGAEADVVMLFPDLSPAAQGEWSRRGSPRDGVARTIYVGITRAKEQLFVCRKSSMAAVNLDVLAS